MYASNAMVTLRLHRRFHSRFPDIVIPVMAAAAPDRSPPTPVSTLSEDVFDAWHFDALGISYVAWLPLLVKQWCGVMGSMGRGDFHLLLHEMRDLSCACRCGFEHGPAPVPLPAFVRREWLVSKVDPGRLSSDE
jgi:hypothetical protein